LDIIITVIASLSFSASI